MSFLVSIVKRMLKRVDAAVSSAIIWFVGQESDEDLTDKEIEYLTQELDDYGIYADYYEKRDQDTN
jgi:hypothetical protein